MYALAFKFTNAVLPRIAVADRLALVDNVAELVFTVPAVLVAVAEIDADVNSVATPGVRIKPIAFMLDRANRFAAASLVLVFDPTALIVALVLSVAAPACCPCFSPVADNDDLVAKLDVATLPLVAIALIVALVAKLDELVLFVTFTLVALITDVVVRLDVATLPLVATALRVDFVASVAELVLFVTFTLVALITDLVVKLDVVTFPRVAAALRVDFVASVAELVLLLTFTPVAFIDARVVTVAELVLLPTFTPVALIAARAANCADAIDATTATAGKIDALVCQPAPANLVRAGGNVNVDLEPMLALAVFAVPPVPEPNARPSAPNLGPAPIECAGGNIPI